MEWPGPRVVPASLADQALDPADVSGSSLALALGANLPSPQGAPLDTLLAVRPRLEQLLRAWARALPSPAGEAAALRCRWSPLFRTAPLGGPADQPDYLNAVLLVDGLGSPSGVAAEALLAQLLELERQFGRRRRERWGPRSLDLDLLWWGALRWRGPGLELPHPRWSERTFVLAPLAALDAHLRPPGAAFSCGEGLSRLLAQGNDLAPQRLAGRPGWPE